MGFGRLIEIMQIVITFVKIKNRNMLLRIIRENITMAHRPLMISQGSRSNQT